MPLSKQKALYTIFLPLARSLVLSPLFSFSLWGRSGTVPECLSELMAFLSHENWSSRIITVIPLFSSRICSVPTEHVSAPPPSTQPALTFSTFWSHPTSFLSHLQVRIHISDAQKKKKISPSLLPPLVCIIHEFFREPPDRRFETWHNWHFVKNKKKRGRNDRYLHLPGDKGQTVLACQELQSKDSKLKLTLDPRILITIDIFQICPPESLNRTLVSRFNWCCCFYICGKTKREVTVRNSTSGDCRSAPISAHSCVYKWQFINTDY